MSSRYSNSPEYRGGGRYRSPPRERYRSPPPRERYRSPPRRGSRRGSSRDRESGCLFIGNIPYDYREHDIKTLFKKMGEIESVTVGINHKTGQPKGHAFVQFRYPQDAQETHHEFQNYVIAGRALHIDWDAGKSNKMRNYRQRRPYDRPRHSRRGSYSRSPPRRRRYSRSPPRRRDSRSPPRRRDSHSRSPRRRDSPRSPVPRRDSRSPVRDRSPMRDSRSPVRDRSPVKGSPVNTWKTGSPAPNEASPPKSPRAEVQETNTAPEAPLSPRE